MRRIRRISFAWISRSLTWPWPSADGWWSPSARRVYLEKAPFLALSAAAAFLAVVARIEFGSLAEVTEVGWGARLAASLYALVFPLWKTVVPVGL